MYQIILFLLYRHKFWRFQSFECFCQLFLLTWTHYLNIYWFKIELLDLKVYFSWISHFSVRNKGDLNDGLTITRYQSCQRIYHYLCTFFLVQKLEFKVNRCWVFYWIQKWLSLLKLNISKINQFWKDSIQIGNSRIRI